MRKNLLAVYGTLKQGFDNHAFLQGAKCIFQGFSMLPYRMYRSHGIPLAYLSYMDKYCNNFPFNRSFAEKLIIFKEVLENAEKRDRHCETLEKIVENIVQLWDKHAPSSISSYIRSSY